jgi:hypothetical protein
MKKFLGGKKKQTIGILIFILAIISLPGSFFAKDKKHGCEVIVKKKDGATIKAELLIVKNDEIILMDSFNMSGITLTADEIQKITITKKSRFFKGIGLGLVIGGGSGALLGFASGDDDSGWFRWTAEEKAVMGGLGLGVVGLLTGGIVGAIKGIDESVVLEGRTPEEMKLILKKLNSRSRFPQDVPQTFQESILKQIQKGKEEDQGKVGDKLKHLNPSTSIDSPKSSGSKFNRIHISLRPGYFASQGTTNTVNLFKKIGFGDTKPGGNLTFLWFSFGSYGPTDFPKVEKNPTFYFSDIRIDYSMTRKWALGIGYAPLGKHAVCGYKFILVNRGKETYYTNLFLKENYSGEMYYLSAAWMPIPDAFLKKFGFSLGVAAGISDIRLNYATSKWEYSDSEGESIKLSKKGLVLAARAEFNYFFNKRCSLGLDTEYRYMPLRVKRIQITGSYDDLTEDMELINSFMQIDIPGHSMNLGGFRLGMNIGIHF